MGEAGIVEICEGIEGGNAMEKKSVQVGEKDKYPIRISNLTLDDVSKINRALKHIIGSMKVRRRLRGNFTNVKILKICGKKVCNVDFVTIGGLLKTIQKVEAFASKQTNAIHDAVDFPVSSAKSTAATSFLNICAFIIKELNKDKSMCDIYVNGIHLGRGTVQLK